MCIRIWSGTIQSMNVCVNVIVSCVLCFGYLWALFALCCYEFGYIRHLIYYHTQLPSFKLKVKNLHYFYGSLSHWWKVTFQENLNIHIYHGKSWYLSTTISEFSASATAQQPQPSFFLLAHRIVGLQSKCFRQPNTERIFFKRIKNDQCNFQSHC